MKYLLILIACFMFLCTNLLDDPATVLLEVSAGDDITIMKSDTINFSGKCMSNMDIEIFNWYILRNTMNTPRLILSQTQQLKYIAPDSACTLSFIFQAKTVNNIVKEDTVIAYVVPDTELIVNAGNDQIGLVGLPVILHATYSSDNIINTFWKIGSNNFVPASPETTFMAPETPLLLPCIFKGTTSDNREATDTVNINVISLDSFRVIANAGNDTSTIAGSQLTLHGTYIGKNITHTFWKIGNSDFTPVPPDTTITLPDTPTIIKCVLKVKNVDLEALDTVKITVLPNIPLRVLAFKDTTIQAGSQLKIHGTYTGNVLKTFWKIGSGPFTNIPPETTITVPDTATSLICILKVRDLMLNEAVDTVIITVVDTNAVYSHVGNDTTVLVNSSLKLSGSYTGNVIGTFWKIGAHDFIPASPETTIIVPSTPLVLSCIFKVVGAKSISDDDTLNVYIVLSDTAQASPGKDTTVAPATTTLQANAGEDQYITVDSTLQLKGTGKDTVNPDNTIVKYEWKYGNGPWMESADGKGIYNPPDIPGSIICSLRVTAQDGQSATDFCIITVLFPVDMVLIPSKGETFKMGKIDNNQASPVHNVTFTKNFFMSRTEITQKEYVSLLTMNPSPVKNDNYPVYNCNWFDAVYYCNARSKSEKMDTVYSYTSISGTIGYGCHMENVKIDYTKKGYRLPTESEWEFACRAGTETDFYWGNSVNTRYLWYRWNSWFRPRTVGGKRPNSFGLYDMSGNVREWCNDWFAVYTIEDKVDPKGPDTGSIYNRIVRNGSYIEGASSSTSFSRSDLEPHTVSETTGFRVVLER